MVKPIYLDPVEPALLVLDGPSLLLITASGQRHRFPIREMERLHIAGNLRLEAAAMHACVAASIPVCFHGTDTSLGYLLSARPTPSRLSSLIETFLQRPDAASRYQDWCSAVERRELLTVLKRLNMRAPDLRPASAESFIVSALPLLTVPAKTLRKLAEGVFALRLAAELAGREVDPLLVASSSSALQVISDCARLLSWSFYADWNQWLSNGTSAISNIRKSAIQCIEQCQARDVARVQSLLDAFSAWLAKLT
jgi:hypothetical protein